jgi:hypothetical protein
LTAARTFITLFFICATGFLRAEILSWTVNYGVGLNNFTYAKIYATLSATADGGVELDGRATTDPFGVIATGSNGTSIDGGTYSTYKFYVQVWNGSTSLGFSELVSWAQLEAADAIGQNEPPYLPVSHWNFLPVPEPSSALLLVMGLAAIAVRRGKRV